MIDTLTQSTKAYLDLLERTRGGNLRHDVKHIELLSDEIIELQTWPVITCDLEHRLKFPMDVGVTFVPTGHPGREIPAQILKYNRTSGRAKIAVAENPPATTGQLVIDFKWLIRRLLQWLEKHGGNVGNPFVSAGDAPASSTPGTSVRSLRYSKLLSERIAIDGPARSASKNFLKKVE